MLDDVDQVAAAVALRTPDFREAIPEGRRELQEAEGRTSPSSRDRELPLNPELIPLNLHPF